MKSSKFKLVFSLIVFIVSKAALAQTYLLPQEESIYSFETMSGKQMVLAKAKDDSYIVYRFGSKTKIEFEFPEKNRNSFSKFKYSFYMRGGGQQNEGIDLNYLYFRNGNYQYVIFDTSSSSEPQSSIGIKVIDLKTNKKTVIKANNATVKGTLINFRDNGLLKIGDELFD